MSNEGAITIWWVAWPLLRTGHDSLGRFWIFRLWPFAPRLIRVTVSK